MCNALMKIQYPSKTLNFPMFVSDSYKSLFRSLYKYQMEIFSVNNDTFLLDSLIF